MRGEPVGTSSEAAVAMAAVSSDTVQAQSMEDRINLHQLMELKAAFDRADTDQGGSLDMEEARRARSAAALLRVLCCCHGAA